MEKILIKDIPSFCHFAKCIEGKIRYSLDELLNLSKESTLIEPHQQIEVQYRFQGFKKGEDLFYLQGFWSTSIRVYCSLCAQVKIMSLSMQYEPIRLLDEKQSSLDCEEESQECRFDIFDMADWIFSEVMVTLPIAPKHEECSTTNFDSI